MRIHFAWNMSADGKDGMMAEHNNPGRFGHRDDTVEQARRGGEASSGSFGEQNSADPSEAGHQGAEAQPTEAKARGGFNSNQGGES